VNSRPDGLRRGQSEPRPSCGSARPARCRDRRCAAPTSNSGCCLSRVRILMPSEAAHSAILRPKTGGAPGEIRTPDHLVRSRVFRRPNYRAQSKSCALRTVLRFLEIRADKPLNGQIRRVSIAHSPEAPVLRVLIQSSNWALESSQFGISTPNDSPMRHNSLSYCAHPAA